VVGEALTGQVEGEDRSSRAGTDAADLTGQADDEATGFEAFKGATTLAVGDACEVQPFELVAGGDAQ
jgi:hypothetical protein